MKAANNGGRAAAAAVSRIRVIVDLLRSEHISKRRFWINHVTSLFKKCQCHAPTKHLHRSTSTKALGQQKDVKSQCERSEPACDGLLGPAHMHVVIFGVFAVLVCPGELVRISANWLRTNWAISKNLVKLANSA